MYQSAKTVIENMFAAFAEGNLDKILETVSKDSVWIYHGTQVISHALFEGKEGAKTFFSNILNSTEVLKFEPRQYIMENNMVVVLGSEHQRVKRSGKELKQQWMQVYTVENNLITRMEKFATSEVVTPGK